jgi:hypothetical protein
MVFYYDWVDRQWQRRPGPKLPEPRYLHRRRLLRRLLAEVEEEGGIIELYTLLLAKGARRHGREVNGRVRRVCRQVRLRGAKAA